MDLEAVANWLSLAATILFPIGGWIVKVLHEKIKAMDLKIEQQADRLDEHKLYAAQTFTTKTDLKAMEDKIVGTLIRIEDKLDRKADK